MHQIIAGELRLLQRSVGAFINSANACSTEKVMPKDPSCHQTVNVAHTLVDQFLCPSSVLCKAATAQLAFRRHTRVNKQLSQPD